MVALEKAARGLPTPEEHACVARRPQTTRARIFATRALTGGLLITTFAGMSKEAAAYESVLTEYDAASAQERSEWNAVQDKSLKPVERVVAYARWRAAADRLWALAEKLRDMANVATGEHAAHGGHDEQQQGQSSAAAVENSAPFASRPQST